MDFQKIRDVAIEAVGLARFLKKAVIAREITITVSGPDSSGELDSEITFTTGEIGFTGFREGLAKLIADLINMHEGQIIMHAQADLPLYQPAEEEG